MSPLKTGKGPQFVDIELCEQSHALLAHIATKGIYGTTVEEVCVRFIDGALVKLCEAELAFRHAVKARPR